MPTANNQPSEVAVEDRVYEIIAQVIDAIKGQLLANAQAIAVMSVNETAQLLKQAGINLLTQRQDVQKLVTKLVNDYANNLAKGGSMCVERLVRQVTPTTAEITPKHVFVSWLDDLQKEVVQEVTDIITHDYAAGIHPYGTTEKLRDYLLRPKHRFEVAARTEAQKLRTDAKVRMMQENGVHYVRYITAGDDRVRPEHQLRNNKIYRMEYAPWLGEYNCRCTLVPADRDVKQGATVTESATETVPLDQLSSIPSTSDYGAVTKYQQGQLHQAIDAMIPGKNDLPRLEGTYGQVRFAGDVRKRLYDSAVDYISNLESDIDIRRDVAVGGFDQEGLPTKSIDVAGFGPAVVTEHQEKLLNEMLDTINFLQSPEVNQLNDMLFRGTSAKQILNNRDKLKQVLRDPDYYPEVIKWLKKQIAEKGGKK